MTDSTMVERCAKAIWAKRVEIGARYGFAISAWGNLPSIDRGEELEIARAAIEAMMPGFLSTLTPEQRTEALKGFDGDDTLGDPASLKGERE